MYLLLFILTVMLTAFQSQNMRGNRRTNKRNKNLDTEDKRLMRALTVNYPLSVFDGKTEDWRKVAVVNSELKLKSSSDKTWIEYSKAQDQEDVWLYENWFYGMKEGVIMESGAIDGLIFSTSYMFEQIANWTAIHVG